MAVKTVEGSLNVLEASEQRIKNLFESGIDVWMSMSGGKDSIVMADIVYELIQKGEIDPKQLTVIFIDEEAVFDDIIRIVKDWRVKFMLAGANFIWYCIQVKHFNCLNTLEDSETFITWDRFKKDIWVREMPPFATTYHPQLREREDTYQTFLERVGRGVFQIVGIRMSESMMRRDAMARIFSNKKNKGGLQGGTYMYPIYDWSNNDIWLHIRNRNLDFPNTYLELWSIGASINSLRLSQFFSIDTAKSLVRLDEHQHGLMEKVIRREPNAYLASLYWDTELFGGRRISRNTDKEEDGEYTDYKKESLKLLADIPANFETESLRSTAVSMRNLVLRLGVDMKDSHWKKLYMILHAGDPKKRGYRGLMTAILSDRTRRDNRNRKLKNEKE